MAERNFKARNNSNIYGKTDHELDKLLLGNSPIFLWLILGTLILFPPVGLVFLYLYLSGTQGYHKK